MPGRSRSTESSPCSPDPPSVAGWHGVGKADSTIKAYESYRAQHLRLIADGSIVVESGVGRVATTTLSTYAHLWPTVEDKTRAAASVMAAAVLAKSPSAETN